VFSLIDCRSEHEIEWSLVSKPQVLHSVLANRNSDRGPRLCPIVTKASFQTWNPPARTNLRYVHLTAHANDARLCFIGLILIMYPPSPRSRTRSAVLTEQAAKSPLRRTTLVRRQSGN
jgi:hypothetical protein